MTRMSSVALALVVACGAIVAAALTMTPAPAAEQTDKITTRAVAEPLQKARAAIEKKQWEAALTEIKKAQAVEKKTPFEAYKIDEFLGYVLIGQKKLDAAAALFERMLNSGSVPADQVDEHSKTVAQLYFQLKDYHKTVEWSKKWLNRHPNELQMSVLLGQSYYLLNDYENATATMLAVINNVERANQTPQESWLQIVLSSQFKLANKEGIAQALKKMVRYYPNDGYWENLLDIYRHQASGDRMTLGYYRLMNDVGVLKNKRDYVEMAQLAMDAGVPGEARRVIEKGMENGTLKSPDKTEQGRYDRLLSSAKRHSTSDEAALAQLAKEAEKSAQGQHDVALGQAYLSYGKYDEAIASLQRGLSKGSVTEPDEAQIDLGIAHTRKARKDLARQAFKTVKNGSKWNDLARLWEIHSQVLD